MIVSFNFYCIYSRCSLRYEIIVLSYSKSFLVYSSFYSFKWIFMYSLFTRIYYAFTIYSRSFIYSLSRLFFWIYSDLSSITLLGHSDNRIISKFNLPFDNASFLISSSFSSNYVYNLLATDSSSLSRNL